MSKVESRFVGNRLSDRIVYQLVRGLVAAFCRVWCRMQVEGRQNIPRTGPFVLAPVHRSLLDTPISAAITWRRMRFMGKDSMWESRAFGRLLSALGGFPVSRGSADREALTRCIAVLRSGAPLVIFPEGERKTGAVVQPLFEGAAYVAVKAGVPVVPVGIGGSERVMPKGARFIRPRKLYVVVGRPLDPPVDGGGASHRKATRQLTADLHAELQRLFDRATALCARRRARGAGSRAQTG